MPCNRCKAKDAEIATLKQENERLKSLCHEEMGDKLKKWEPSADAFAWCRENTPIEDDDNSLRVTVSMKELRNKDASIARLKEESIGWIKQFRMDSEAINKLEAEYAAIKEKVHAASEYVLQIEAWNNEDCDIDIEEMVYDLKQILTEK
jgi:hypothetical protein